jgi:starch-binding outer membrane protein, SusD/RagB family
MGGGIMRNRIQHVAVVVAMLSLVGCDSFFEVSDPDLLESTAIDPTADGPTLARSAFQNLVDSYGDLVVYSAWWAYEARVGDTFPTRNEFGRRFIDDTNGTLNGEVWSPLVRAATTGEQVVSTLKDVGGLPLAIAAFTEGYAMLLMAETFCEGTVAPDPQTPGPRLSTADMLDLAVERLTLAQSEATKAGGSEGSAIATAALVGTARAHLQAGRKPEAAAAAALVPASFQYDFKYVDDAANRGRVGNNVWNFTTSRTSLVVPPEYIAIADAGDPRVQYEDANKLSQDSELPFIKQLKYPGYGAAVRLASGLEARYIQAEATGSMADRLALIAERRAVGQQTTFTSTDPVAVLAELMEQRARDFWLEAKKMGDYRRNGSEVPYFLPDNGAYYKPGAGTMGDQQCWPVPDAEKRTNPNFSK